MVAYAIATFLGAFLLFEVQLLIGKAVLPWFGGAPAVWTACLVFFQVALLAGYAYAHAVAVRARPRLQRAVHLAALASGAAALFVQVAAWGVPLLPGPNWKPTGSGHPATQITLLLLASVGLPFVVLAATSPLLQAWAARSIASRSPYPLYAASSLGSLAGLLAYPLLVEPTLALRGQAWSWAVAFLVWAAACGALARRQASGEATTQTVGAPPLAPGRQSGAVAVALWVALPCAGAALLLAITNQICQEVAVVPLLWVVPLALYLLSFALCFESERTYRRGVFLPLLAASLGLACVLLYYGVDVPVPLQIGGYSLVLFACCMTCHGELARAKPAPRFLTAYYLALAAGGALGGVLVGVVAPLVFSGYWELHAGLAACGALVVLALLADRDSWLNRGRRWPAIATLVGATAGALWLLRVRDTRLVHGVAGAAIVRFIVVAAGALLLLVWVERRRDRAAPLSRPIVGVVALGLALALLSLVLRAHIRAIEARETAVARDFFGVVSVEEGAAPGDLGGALYMRHGPVVHGFQLTAPALRDLPTSYFAAGSGIALALRDCPRRSAVPPQPLRVGVIGLGVGTLAAYGRAGDEVRFYEISPAVIRFAAAPGAIFTFLADTRARVEVVPGDGRIALEREERQGTLPRFDVLAMDAFSGGAVPIHLLTREAFAIYLARLDPEEGILAINISNRNVDLRGVVARLAAAFGLSAVVVDAPRSADDVRWPSLWALLTRDRDFLSTPEVAAAARPLHVGRGAPLWTDDHSSLLSVLVW
jgi:hypothetical protein